MPDMSAPLEELMAQARDVRRRAHGELVTYSPKVFIPLTMLCRDRCGYCTFAQPPARLESPFLEPAQVLALARAGARVGCHEALFTLGEAPEERYPVAAEWLSDRGHGSTIDYLLAMARLEEGRLGPRGDVDLDELVMAQAPRLRDLVELDLSAVSAGRVWGNGDELTSVVRNLLDNAARHARGRVAVSVSEQGPWVLLTVADDGAGVPAEQREQVFERFARLQEGRSRDSGGTGLGLALTRRIVEHHGGRIHVEDGPLGGARFVVSLPAAGAAGPGPAARGRDTAGEAEPVLSRPG